MIEVRNMETTGWEAAVRGMRNPLNSWTLADSSYVRSGTPEHPEIRFRVGKRDLELATRLVHAGPDHCKFLRMINISADILAPLYWWKEYDTYKVGTVADSCSTMHTIAARRFSTDDFSHEHLEPGSIAVLETVVKSLNHWRGQYLKTKDKNDWWQLIQLLPSSFNQLRTVTLNYEVARRQYHARCNHKLDEWCSWCETLATLPCSRLITDE